MQDLENILTQGFCRLGFPPDDALLTNFRRYYDFLAEQSAVMDLTAISGESDTARLHFLDSLSVADLRVFASKSVIDVGSGAGFPGLPLKLAVPSMKLTLLDAQEKRTRFLAELCSLLDAHEVNIIHARAEDASKRADLRGQFDIAVSRAVAGLNVLCELCLPFVKPGGAFIAMKGVHSDDEIAGAKTAIEVLGGKLEDIRDYTIPDTDIRRRSVIVRKTGVTPVKYPRRFARIMRQPL